ncbi:MAG TPA: metalloregulator ArsR/SmtB family transcription factor [Methylomirabilota bacterium]|jgi:ArsR family transcriptional regulator|nr:metalloregulator ArsR/SmtB family transcription factor [Methylomirabilota bacterium]
MTAPATRAFFPLREDLVPRVARWFHALSDETRLRIVDRLSDGEKCVCDLTDLLDTAQSRLSFHLKTLKDAGILKDRREGRWVYYSLNPDVVEDLEQFLHSLTDCCRKLTREASSCCK